MDGCSWTDGTLMCLPRVSSYETGAHSWSTQLEHTCSGTQPEHHRLPSAAGGAADPGRELVLAGLPLPCGISLVGPLFLSDQLRIPMSIGFLEGWNWLVAIAAKEWLF